MCIRMLLFCKKLQEQNQKHHWLASSGRAPKGQPAEHHEHRRGVPTARNQPAAKSRTHHQRGVVASIEANPPNSMSISRVCFCRRSGTERIMCTGSQHHAHQKGFALPRARVISVAKNRKPATSCASVGCCFANTRPGGNKSRNNHINQKPTSRAS